MKPRMPSASEAMPMMATGPLASETPRRGGTVSSYLSLLRTISVVLLEAVTWRIAARARLHACAFIGMTLGLPAVAAAAPFRGLPFRTVPTAAVCVRATGVPGELIRWTRGGVELMQARADGLHDARTVRAGTLNQCPAVAADATTGAAVVAGTTPRGIAVAVRGPGGAWAAPVTISTPYYPGVRAAVSPRGDAIVAWVE